MQSTFCKSYCFFVSQLRYSSKLKVKLEANEFLNEFKKKFHLESIDDWNSITRNQIKLHGGNHLFKKYSLFDLKCIACPEGKLTFKPSPKPSKYWENKENVQNFLSNLKEKLNLKTKEDWNSITHKEIRLYGGNSLLYKYSLYELKCLAFPEGKSIYKVKKSSGYWNNEENVVQFLLEFGEKFNLKTREDWNLITQKQIKLHGGGRLFNKYSLYELKCLGFPDGKLYFNNSPKASGYWNNKENLLNFLKELKEKLNLESQEDWDLLTWNKIQLHGGGGLFYKYSLNELKKLGFPKGNFNTEENTLKYLDNKENLLEFLNKLKEKLNLHSFEDWNSLTHKMVESNGGSSWLKKYSLFELKCFGFPDGKLKFTSENKPAGFWNNQENVLQFLNELKEKLNLQSFEDWNSIHWNKLALYGGNSLREKYSLYELKCFGFPDGKLKFNSENKPAGYWNNQENVLQFLDDVRVELNLNSANDWNSITYKQIESFGGGSLLQKYSLYELKCLGFPDGKHIFDPTPKPSGYWDDENNILNFIKDLKENYNLQTIEDWNRLSKKQIQFLGGDGLVSKLSINKIIKLQNPNVNIKFLKNSSKRSSQRWLFLQVKKLFPDDEVVEDYFHSEISRETGFSVQFDVFLINKNIAIEYHGQQHYEDLPFAFSPVEMYKTRDEEKIKLCSKYGISLVVIPYWWDNQLDSLKTTLDNVVRSIVK